MDRTQEDQVIDRVMGLFICAKCNHIDNTALGHYWCHKDVDMFKWDKSNEEFKGKPLCSIHAPKRFKDGSLTGWGKWHNKFKRRHKNKLAEEELQYVINIL